MTLRKCFSVMTSKKMTPTQAGLPLVALNQWPEEDAPYLRQDLLAYYHAVLDLGRDLLSLIAQGLGQSSDFAAAYQKPLGLDSWFIIPPWKTRLSAPAFRAAAHTDFGVSPF